MVVKQGMLLATIGIAVGVTASLVLTRLLATVLYGVQPRDPLAFLAASAILAVVALLAAWLPARRALRIDPIEALRYT